MRRDSRLTLGPDYVNHVILFTAERIFLDQGFSVFKYINDVFINIQICERQGEVQWVRERRADPALTTVTVYIYIYIYRCVSWQNFDHNLIFFPDVSDVGLRKGRPTFISWCFNYLVFRFISPKNMNLNVSVFVYFLFCDPQSFLIVFPSLFSFSFERKIFLLANLPWRLTCSVSRRLYACLMGFLMFFFYFLFVFSGPFLHQIGAYISSFEGPPVAHSQTESKMADYRSIRDLSESHPRLIICYNLFSENLRQVSPQGSLLFLVSRSSLNWIFSALNRTKFFRLRC